MGGRREGVGREGVGGGGEEGGAKPRRFLVLEGMS